ncbi:MAG TPA: histone deacetylase [Candidatus Dormibacteraeota bacterium]|nr:histone deacetylase [Candidatus Dormibacteraeota bacterium]
MTVPLALIRNDDQSAHASPGHPERPDRVDAILEGIAAENDLAALPWLDAPVGRRALPLLVHTEDEVRRVEGLAVKGGGWFDPDTYCTTDSYVVALNAAACASRAAEAVMQGETRSAFAVIRPPGHHATPDLPMGFCLFNNAAIAVRSAQNAGATRVAIVDIDVHHGNGSQDIFYADPSVLYASLHQFPWYPGTGHASDRGDPGASGTTVNVPVPPGTSATRWLEMFDTVVLPEVAAFDPELIVVSAGFDAHREDPLAELRLEDATYTAIAERVRTLSDKHCEGRSLWLLEGGYDLRAIAASVAGCLHVLAA